MSTYRSLVIIDPLWVLKCVVETWFTLSYSILTVWLPRIRLNQEPALIPICVYLMIYTILILWLQKSFEETMESIEKAKAGKDKSDWVLFLSSYSNLEASHSILCRSRVPFEYGVKIQLYDLHFMQSSFIIVQIIHPTSFYDAHTHT